MTSSIGEMLTTSSNTQGSKFSILINFEQMLHVFDPGTNKQKLTLKHKVFSFEEGGVESEKFDFYLLV